MAKTNVHVVPRPGGQWSVKREGSSRASSVADTQKAAIESARKIAVQERSELVVHGKNGQIREKNSYGSDPSPPKG